MIHVARGVWFVGENHSGYGYIYEVEGNNQVKRALMVKSVGRIPVLSHTFGHDAPKNGCISF